MAECKFHQGWGVDMLHFINEWKLLFQFNLEFKTKAVIFQKSKGEVYFNVHVKILEIDPPLSSCLLCCHCFYTGTWEWLSDSPSLLPPCSEAVSYYSQFGRIPGFTSGAGRRFRKVLDEHLDLLCWPDGVKVGVLIDRVAAGALGQNRYPLITPSCQILIFQRPFSPGICVYAMQFC